MEKNLEKTLKKFTAFQEKTKGHRARVKERFWKEGPESFTDEDLLELLLFFGIPRRDTRGLARALLKRFDGRLDKILDAEKEELIKIPQLGLNAILPLRVMHEVARRYLRARIENSPSLKSPKEVFEYLLYELKGEKKEVFMVLYLATDNRVLGIERISEGTIVESAVYPREVFARAYQFGASKLVLAHNHPSGNLKPSVEDKKITRIFILGGFLLQLKILDHLIIGKDSYYSFAEEGLIEELEREVRKVL
ncbi:DNA repair protein RadC [Caldimicrobium thiodismutans]|jgi:DNA repair protein RadC|uniref:DNA repair protein RadC n=1 Tax=Caldimicrobium thiodismutans TaxID=1653476 RepID=A0A0U5AF46_9BACT|nr:DNA repair protein RadC [Caldimicrobium thiodismutans]BAU22631.1 DNA repair protein RadC [Caldimicrobium thiodismutans]